MTTRDELAQRARLHLEQSVLVMGAVARHCLDDIVAAAALLTESFRAGGRLYLCGNGGSAADCQHMAAELVSRLTREFDRPGLPAVALTTDTSFLTAYSNDLGFEGVFERQIQALGRSGDTLLAISTSGASVNVRRAVVAARALGMRTIALTGSGGRLGDLADLTITIPSSRTQQVQESHLAVEHILCDLVEQALFGPDATPAGRP
jgi:D-sedoheptulose 7-phosphate isomerase